MFQWLECDELKLQIIIVDVYKRQVYYERQRGDSGNYIPRVPRRVHGQQELTTKLNGKEILQRNTFGLQTDKWSISVKKIIENSETIISLF